jgi:putative flippase GtrA
MTTTRWAPRGRFGNRRGRTRGLDAAAAGGAVDDTLDSALSAGLSAKPELPGGIPPHDAVPHDAVPHDDAAAPGPVEPDRQRGIGGHAAWYLAAGVVTTGLQAALFLLLRPELGAQWANLTALAITTVGNTEFHRRVTFAGRASRAGKRHFQDLATFAFYAGYGSVVLAALDAVAGQPSAAEQTIALLAASFVGGVIRFAVLRWWVFARRGRV